MSSSAYICFALLSLVTYSSGSVNLDIPCALSDKTTVRDKIISQGVSFIQLAERNGYEAEEHDVTTEDGYILRVHRIPSKRHCTRKTPIVMAHGLLQASETFIDAGPSAPGFVLAGECYDVWFTNFRGNYNSRRHTSLDPDQDAEFWHFSVDQFGAFDLPAIVDLVLNYTSSNKLILIGTSLGGGSYFVMNSERPDYASKISLFIGLTPATRLLKMKSLIFRSISENFNEYRLLLADHLVWEVMTKCGLSRNLSSLCRSKLFTSPICLSITSAIFSSHSSSVTPEIETRVAKHYPAGTSVQNWAHIWQVINSLKFPKFNFGSEDNLARYGSSEPPEHNLTASVSPIVIIHGLSDTLVDSIDLKWLITYLPNVLEYKELDDPLWNHFDFFYSKFWNETVFTHLKPYLKTYDGDF